MCVLSVPTCSNRSKARAVFSGVECVRSAIRAVLQYLVAIYCSCMHALYFRYTCGIEYMYIYRLYACSNTLGSLE